jgi:hypothetical protein
MNIFLLLILVCTESLSAPFGYTLYEYKKDEVRGKLRESLLYNEKFQTMRWEDNIEIDLREIIFRLGGGLH